MDALWRKDKNGKFITREMQCDCGKAFVQTQVSKRFVQMFLPNDNCIRLFKHASPEGFLPCFCPPCERKAIGREGDAAQAAEKREAARAARPESWRIGERVDLS